MSLKKLATAFVSCLMLVLLAGALASCVKSAESIIKDDIAKQFDKVKKLDAETAQSLASSLTAKYFEIYGIDSTSFVQSYFKDFDYSVGDIAVSGSTATATVTLTCKSFTELKSAIDEATSSLNDDPEFAALDHDDQYKRIGSIVVAALDSATPSATIPITIRYVKNGDAWSPVEKTSQTIAKALLAN